jgi:hypothetical protein
MARAVHAGDRRTKEPASRPRTGVPAGRCERGL